MELQRVVLGGEVEEAVGLTRPDPGLLDELDVADANTGLDNVLIGFTGEGKEILSIRVELRCDGSRFSKKGFQEQSIGVPDFEHV